MEIQHDFNFNEPLELTEIFRLPGNDGLVQEFSAKLWISWEDIKAIKAYPFPDNWETYKGPKFTVLLNNHPEILIYGEVHDTVAYWALFKTKYPIFGTRADFNGEDDGED